MGSSTDTCRTSTPPWWCDMWTWWSPPSHSPFTEALKGNPGNLSSKNDFIYLTFIAFTCVGGILCWIYPFFTLNYYYCSIMAICSQFIPICRKEKEKSVCGIFNLSSLVGILQRSMQQWCRDGSDACSLRKNKLLEFSSWTHMEDYDAEVWCVAKSVV